MTGPDPFRSARRSVSVVLPVLNESASLAVLLPRIAAILDGLGLDWEAVVIDDGGSDNLGWTIADFERTHPASNVQLIRLSRNFGKEAALTAGLRAARGDAAICMDGDGQHPPELMVRMIERWRSGYDMVMGAQTRRDQEPPLLVWAKRIFYRLLQRGERFAIPSHAGDFRLLDRRVVDALLQLPERSRYMKGLYAWLGFRWVIEPFTADERISGSSKFRLGHLIELAALGLTSFSMRPLRMVSGIGIGISLLALCYGIYIAVETLVIGNPVSGWTTLASGIMLLSGIQLVCLGVMAEYLGRIFEETKQRPLYVIDTVTDHSRLGSKPALQQVQG